MMLYISFIKTHLFIFSMIFKRSWWFRYYQCFWEILRQLQRLRVEKLDIYFLKELLSFLIKKKSSPCFSLITSKLTRKQQTTEHKWKSRSKGGGGGVRGLTLMFCYGEMIPLVLQKMEIYFPTYSYSSRDLVWFETHQYLHLYLYHAVALFVCMLVCTVRISTCIYWPIKLLCLLLNITFIVLSRLM